MRVTRRSILGSTDRLQAPGWLLASISSEVSVSMIFLCRAGTSERDRKKYLCFYQLWNQIWRFDEEDLPACGAEGQPL